MGAGVEHVLRLKALRYGPNPFCLCCGQLRERHGATICRECRGWANTVVLKASRRRLRASFAIIDGGRLVRQ